MKYLTYLLVFTAVTFGQLLPDYTCSDSLSGMFPVYYWQPEDSLLVLRWCYGVADTGSYCSLAESDITVPEFVHPETGVHFLPYDSLDLSQASDSLDILILYDRSRATCDDLRTRSLVMTVEDLLSEILQSLDGSSSCFTSNIRVFFAGYASPGCYFQYEDEDEGYWIHDIGDDFASVFNFFADCDLPVGFNQDYNDPFGALLWAMDSWNSIVGVRPKAEKVIFVITNSPPRSDTLSPTHLDGSETEIRRKLIRFAHGIPETLIGQPRQPKGAFQVFFLTPPSDFDCSYAEPYPEWRDYWDGIYTTYEDWGIEFETGDSANDYYSLPFLYLDIVDSEWIEQDSIDGDLITYRDKVFDFLHHHLVRVWYRPGTGIEEDNGDLPDDFAISAYPNPFNGNCRIMIDDLGLGIEAIEVFDVNGRKIQTLPTDPTGRPSATSLHKGGTDFAPFMKGGQGGSYVWTPDASLGSGVYLVRIEHNGVTYSTPVVYIK